MKKWEIIRNITLSLFIVSLIPILWWLLESIWCQINGEIYIIPGPGLAKWYDIFIFKSFWYLVIWATPAIIDVILFIVAIVKTKKMKRGNNV